MLNKYKISLNKMNMVQLVLSSLRSCFQLCPCWNRILFEEGKKKIENHPSFKAKHQLHKRKKWSSHLWSNSPQVLVGNLWKSPGRVTCMFPTPDLSQLMHNSVTFSQKEYWSKVRFNKEYQYTSQSLRQLVNDIYL